MSEIDFRSETNITSDIGMAVYFPLSKYVNYIFIKD